MLNFMRSNAKNIVATTVTLFIISLFGIGGYSFLNRGPSSSENKAVEVSNVALFNGKPVDEMKFYREFNRLVGSVPENQRILLDPDLIDYYKYDALQKSLTYMLMLDQAKSQGIKATSSEANMRINQLLKIYQMSSMKQLKQTLSERGITWKSFKKEQKEEIVVAKFINGITSRVAVTPLDKKMAFTKIETRHILIKRPEGVTDNLKADIMALKKAESIYEMILSDKSAFGDIAKKHSEDKQSAKEGGYLGWVSRGQMVPEFEKLLYTLEPNEIGGPIKSMFGYHIIKVIDRKVDERPEGITDEQLSAKILQDKQNEALEKWIAPLKESGTLDYKDGALLAYDARVNGRYENALLEYQKLSSGQNNLLVLIQIARMYEKLDRLPDAEKQYKKAQVLQNLNPRQQYPILYFSTIDFYKKNGKADVAYDLWSKAKTNFFNNAIILNYLASNYRDVMTEQDEEDIALQIDRLTNESNPPDANSVNSLVPLRLTSDNSSEGDSL